MWHSTLPRSLVTNQVSSWHFPGIGTLDSKFEVLNEIIFKATT